MRVLHVIPNFRLGEPQIAVLEFCRVARMRGIDTSVLALSDEGVAARQLLDEQLVSTQTLGSDAVGALQMQVLQNSVDVVQSHTAADFTRILPAVSNTNVRLFHTFHSCSSQYPRDFPAGNGYLDRAGWISGMASTGPFAERGLVEVIEILDGVWSPPIESLNAGAQRRALGVESDVLLIGVSGLDGGAPVMRALDDVRAEMSTAGVDAHFVVFGGPESDEAPRGATFVTPDESGFVERFEALDIFLQLSGADFSQLSLLSLARCVPVVLPRPELPELFRGGWNPFRFEPGDMADAAQQLLNYAEHPEMHAVHRKLVRDYVLTFRDSMSMVGSYARLYGEQAAECASC